MKESDVNLLYGFRNATFILCGCTHDSDDILQEAAIAIIRNIEKFNQIPDDEKSYYIGRVIRNKFIDSKRKVKRRGVIGNLFYSKSVAPDIYSKIELKEFFKNYESYITSDAAVLFAAGYNVNDIQNAMKITINTTTARLRYGRMRLRKIRDNNE